MMTDQNGPLRDDDILAGEVAQTPDDVTVDLNPGTLVDGAEEADSSDGSDSVGGFGGGDESGAQGHSDSDHHPNGDDVTGEATG